MREYWLVVTLVFQVAEPQSKVLLCGDIPELGKWNPNDALPLTCGEGNLWSVNVELEPGTPQFTARTRFYLCSVQRAACSMQCVRVRAFVCVGVYGCVGGCVWVGVGVCRCV